jgi:peptidoglycan/xylan/chitin deacetylase (PgdA/CDA1 family)/ubiquinone/menaquinone biosynthesis C-methylase UbiE
MKPRRSFTPARLAWADLVGLGALQLAIVCVLVDWRWAALPLGLYLAITFVAPFFPRLGYFLPIITHGPREASRVALTFDDGPHPSTTPPLLDLLDRHQVKATFFVVGRQCEAHPELLRDIIDRGHDVGNHTGSHDVLFALRTRRRVRAEIRHCQRALAAQGVRTLAFRPPVSITNPRLWPVLQAEDLLCIHWSRRAGDRGNRRVAGLARRLLPGLRAGDIVLLHDCPPPGPGPGSDKGDGDVDGDVDASVATWLAEVEALLKGLAERNLQAVSLSTLLGVPITTPTTTRAEGDRSANPVRVFYDRLAPDYDAEQDQASMSPVRRVEQERILDTIASWHPRAVLELGVGSGRFTLPLAQRADHVLAVDVSPRMLDRLTEKAARAGLTNIETRVGDLADLPLEGPFSHICAFSVFEYIRDLDTLVARLATLLEPGGTLYFTTARRSFARLFVQVGNALRQGLWLHARSARQLRRALTRAGLVRIKLRAHALRGPLGGGLLWEVSATRPRHDRSG